jgi:transposase, IS5 family
VQHHLAANKLQVATGTIVDAVPAKAGIINARPRPGTAPAARPRLTKRGNQWHFGLKAYVGADSRTKLILAVVATLADRRVLPDLLAWPRGPGGATRPIAVSAR